MHSVERIVVESTNRILVDRLEIDGVLVTDAADAPNTIVATVLDATEAEVPDSGSPISLEAVVGVAGSYVGTIEHEADLAVGDKVTVKLTVTLDDLGVGVIYTECRVVRGSG